MRLKWAVCVTTLFLASCDQPVSNPRPPSEVGRYVIVHSPEAERDTILLDTVTGKTWSRVEVTDITDNPPAWDPMPQLNSVDDIRALGAAHGLKAKPSPSR